MMEVRIFSHRYGGGGNSPIYSVIADLLMTRLGNYGSAVDSIEITVNLRTNSKKEKRNEEYQGFLNALPKITFQRKRKTIQIEFVSDKFTVADDRGHDTAEKTNMAMPEIADVLFLIKKRIKNSDDFDTARFLTDVTDILTTQTFTQAEWEKIDEEGTKVFRAIYDSKDPWELLDIDWDKYHPEARTLLDDPFFWDETDDFAPNGNDTGADLLDAFRRWHKGHPDTSPLRVLEKLFKSWDVRPIPWSLRDKAEVERLEKEAPIPIGMCNEASIALAFAVIKFRGECPGDVAEIALAGLDRWDFVDDRDEWKASSKKMREKLEMLNDK